MHGCQQKNVLKIRMFFGILNIAKRKFKRVVIMQNEYFGKDIKKLGFGLMRLPKHGPVTDVAETSKMVDLFIENGFTYFDTAFVYVGSEAAAKKALVDRYPRESYTLASKLFAAKIPSAKIAKAELETSLKRTGAGYLDFYLLHSLMDSNYTKYDKFGIWDFVKEAKAAGKIKHWGFSFHGSPELLDKLLTEHPDAEFVQLQINYADWENPKVRSREVYETARKHGKSIVVMEPVKGGKLADPPEEVKKLFKEINPDASYASWAIRFAASLDGILTVLSGMSNSEQMLDNISFMKDFKPLNETELAAVKKAQEIFNKSCEIPCTACRYCTEGCPKGISIPDLFAIRNKQLTSGKLNEAKSEYAEFTLSNEKASACIGCGQCETVCPQKIDIIAQLKACAEIFE